MLHNMASSRQKGVKAITRHMFDSRSLSGDVTFRVPSHITPDDLVFINPPPLMSGYVDMKAHKLVLEARSERFRAMFNSQMREAQPNPLIEIRDVCASVFDALLKWFYLDELPDEDELETLLDLRCVAERYLLTELEVACFRRLMVACCDRKHMARVLIYATCGSVYASCGYHDGDIVPFAKALIAARPFDAITPCTQFTDKCTILTVLASAPALFLTDDDLITLIMDCLTPPCGAPLVSDTSNLSNDDGTGAGQVSGHKRQRVGTSNGLDDIDDDGPSCSARKKAATSFLMSVLPLLRLGSLKVKRAAAHFIGTSILPKETAFDLVNAVLTKTPNAVVSAEMLGKRGDLKLAAFETKNDGDKRKEAQYKYFAQLPDGSYHYYRVSDQADLTDFLADRTDLLELNRNDSAPITAARIVLQLSSLTTSDGYLALSLFGRCPASEDGDDDDDDDDEMEGIIELWFGWSGVSTDGATASWVAYDGDYGCEHTTDPQVEGAQPEGGVPVEAGSIWRCELTQVAAPWPAEDALPVSSSSSSSSSSAAARDSRLEMRYQLTVHMDLKVAFGPCLLPAGHRVTDIDLAVNHDVGNHRAEPAGTGAAAAVNLHILHASASFVDSCS